MREFAPAKINLYLHVVGKRADGYHLLDSLAVFAGAGDSISWCDAEAMDLLLAGPESGQLEADPSNLVLRAARALAGATGHKPHGVLELVKNLPVASGIGGGSADAAATLRLLARNWGVTADLAAIAAELGADVPVCVASVPARMQGVGEQLSASPVLPPLGMVLANPRIALPTPAVFKARQGGFSPSASLPAGWNNAADLAADLGRLSNDLEPAAIGLCPAVAEVLAALRQLPDVLLARMSGSGATCFALFPSADAAAHAATLLPEFWWRWGGGLYEPV